MIKTNWESRDVTRLPYDHDPEGDGAWRWSHKGPITRANPGTRKNDTLWCDVCARGRAVGLEQSAAIKTGHESGPREGGGEGEENGPVGASCFRICFCTFSSVRVFKPRFRSLLRSSLATFVRRFVCQQICDNYHCYLNGEITGLKCRQY